MPEITTYKPGTPSWVDFASPDLDASIEFYGGLFGWDVPESENAEQTGGYRQAMKDGRPAGGMMPQMQEGQPSAWTTYVSVEDAEATAAAVKEAGGTVMAEPMEVMDLGTMAIFADPTGAVFGDLAARDLPRRRRRQRARRDRLERAQHPRPRRRQGVLRRRLRLDLRRPGDGGRRDLHDDRARRAARSAASSTWPRAASRRWCPPTGRSTSASRTPTRRSRRPRRPAAASCSSRSTSRPAASRSSPTRTGRASR